MYEATHANWCGLELFPEAQKPDNNNYGYTGFNNSEEKRQPYETKFSFYHATITEKNREAYVELFEAAWRGDLDTIKDLCLRKVAPLQVAVQDTAGYSPFSIALVQGHRDLASAILDISTAQYKPSDNEAAYRYRMRGAEDDDEDSDVSSEDDSDSDRLVLKQIVDDKFTIDDINVLADGVQSKVAPLTMLQHWNCELWRAAKGDADKKEPPARHTSYHNWRYSEPSSWNYFYEALDHMRSPSKVLLCEWAVDRGNLELLRFLISAGTDMMKRKARDDDTRIYQLDHNIFERAIQIGNTDIVAEIIKTTGAGVPLQKMIQSSGVVINEKPRFYQGLSVYGKKRQDWAERDAPRTQRAKESEYSPLLRAILLGDMKSIEYFYSDSPVNRYLEFAKSFKDDSLISSLAKAEGGVEKALTTWLSTRSDLAVHMAVMAPPEKDGSTPVLDYILRVMPGAIDIKTKAEGLPPLQLAFELGRISAAERLIKAGANQATRAHNGENLLHTILTNNQLATPIMLPRILKLLETQLIQPLLLEKCAIEPGSLTPLARYLQHHREESVIQIILEESKGKDLEILNGAGDFPIHTLVRQNQESLVKFLVDYRPEMLYWENAVGMTVVDVAETQYLRSIIESPPILNRNGDYSIKNESDSKFSTKKIEKSDRQKEIEKLLEVSAEDLQGVGADSTWRMNRLLNKLSEQYPGKRKLVSVIEANEVARRLAEQQQKKNAETKRRERLGLNAGRGYDGDSDANEQSSTKGYDEVSMWKHENNGAWDLVFWELKIRKERGEVVDEAFEREVLGRYGLSGQKLRR